MIRAFFLPALVAPHELAGRSAIVIDVLRATTTITQALAAGARAVVPCETVEQARDAARQVGTAVLTGGERGGVRISGFQLGNSPTEYSSPVVNGKTLVFTTTNGTRALLHCRQARRILLASFVNQEAVVRAIREDPEVDVVCAGTEGQITLEDVLLAGAIVQAWLQWYPDAELNDQARLAWGYWDSLRIRDDDQLAAALRATHGGRHLRELGYDADIVWSARRSQLAVVGMFDPRSGAIGPLDTTSP